MTGAVAFVSIVGGGVSVNESVGRAVTIKDTEVLNLWSAAAYAVSVTVEPTISAIWSGDGTVKVILVPAF